MMGRFDLHVEVTPVSYDELSTNECKSESSTHIRQRVKTARKIQEERFKEYSNIHSNAQIPIRMVGSVCALDQAGQTLLKTAMKKL